MTSRRPYSGTQDPRRFHRSLVDMHVLLPGQGKEYAPFQLSDLTAIIDGVEADGGYGTFRSVFADGLRGEAPVAGLKIFKPVQEVAGPETARRFCEEEYSILCELSGEGGHAPMPYMLGTYDMAMSTRPYDAGVEYPAILMEHLDAADLLSKQVGSGNLFGGHAGAEPTPERTLEVGLELARALESCHGKILSDGREGIVHRDVSPRNVFVRLSPDGKMVRQAVLIDFGQSTRLESRVSTRGRPGTIAFAAPEMNEDAKAVICPDGEPLYSKRNAPTVDIYSLGAVMYYIRTGGKVPYSGRLSNNRSGGELEVKRDFPLGTLDVVEPSESGLDVALDELIRECTRFFPEERPQSAAEVKRRIERLLAVEEMNAPVPVGIATPPPRVSHGAQAPKGAIYQQTMGTAMRGFAEEFEISVNEAYEMMQKMGYGADGCLDFVRDSKWRMISSMISSNLGLDSGAVMELLPTDGDIEPGCYEEELAHWMGVFVGLGMVPDIGRGAKETIEISNTPPPKKKDSSGSKTYTVIYTDGAGGEIFPDMEYTVEAGAKTPRFHPDSLERDGYVARGWSRAVAETVQGDVVYTMRWIRQQVDDAGEHIQERVSTTLAGRIPQLITVIGAFACLALALANIFAGGGLLP